LSLTRLSSRGFDSGWQTHPVAPAALGPIQGAIGPAQDLLDILACLAEGDAALPSAIDGDHCRWRRRRSPGRPLSRTRSLAEKRERRPTRRGASFAQAKARKKGERM